MWPILRGAQERAPQDDVGAARGYKFQTALLAYMSVRSRGTMRPGFAFIFHPAGCGECRVPNAPAAAYAKVESIRVSHHGRAGSPGIPARDGVNGFLRALPGDRLSCHRRQWSCFRQLDASVGASGPHGFAVRESALSSLAPFASIASRLASVTISSRPSVRQDGERHAGDLGRKEIEIFLRTGLDDPNHVDSKGEFFLNAQAWGLAPRTHWPPPRPSTRVTSSWRPGGLERRPEV
jgi:hypothetical protein